MAKTGRPRSGSMQFWPRKRAKRPIARVSNPKIPAKTKPALFAGYKVGMTHVSLIDNRKTSPTKGTEIIYPATIIECPPLKVMGVRLYKKAYQGKNASIDIFSDKQNKELSRKIKAFKSKKSLDKINEEDFDNLKIIVHTNPAKTGIGKKKPEMFEIPIGGSKQEQLAYAKEKLGHELNIQEVFSEGTQLSIHAITKGKGYQGSVKRFGIGLKESKSEKGRRAPGSLGGWKAQGHVMYRVAFPGKMGFHQRTEYNKRILKISETPKELNVKGGFKKYGEVKNNCVVVKGSIAGPAKRLIIMSESKRPNDRIPAEAPAIEEISTTSHQGK